MTAADSELHSPIQAFAVTERGRHAFFGYFDKCPWNASQHHLLAHRAGFAQRMPRPEDELELGLVDMRSTEPEFRRIATTRAWSWQQGAMLQWWGGEAEKTVCYNDCREGQLVSVLHEIDSGGQRVFPRPVGALSRDGRWAGCLNFARLHDERPGYGYANTADPFSEILAPEEDGLDLLDMRSGRVSRLVSLAELAARDPEPSMRGVKHWINHLLFSPSGNRLAFLHRWRMPHGAHRTRFYTIGRDGRGLRCLNDHGMTSHFDWWGEDRIVAWAWRNGVGDRYFLFTDGGGEVEIIGEERLTPLGDGHCTVSPDGQWLLTDTYPDARGLQRLVLFHLKTDHLVRLGEFPSRTMAVPMRCDLHPRWSRDGKQICFDSNQDGHRRVYVMDVGKSLAYGL